MFPENEVEILPDYIPDDLATVLTKVRDALQASIISLGGEVVGPQADRVEQIVQDRKRFLVFLKHELFDKTLDLMDEIGDLFQGREFKDALTLVDRLDDASTAAINIGSAFFSTPISFVEVQERLRPSGRGDREHVIKVRVPRVLPGYQGPHPPVEQISQIMRYNSLLSGGSERAFRMGVLRAECRLGLRQFDRALDEYQALLDDRRRLRPEQVGFVTLRKGFAHLARGDAIFRKSRDLSDDDLDRARKEYEAAVAVIEAHGISRTNPLFGQIESYAEAQLAKLEAGFNAIGFTDNYVPRLRAGALFELADTRVRLAEAAVEKYRNFRQEANRLDDEEAETRLESDINALSAEIAEERRQIEGLEEDKLDVRIDAIQTQLGSLLEDTAKSVTVGAMVMLGSAAAEQPAGALQSAAGIMTTLIGYGARQNELENELKAARIEQQILEREQHIADLEKDIVAARGAFLKRRLEKLGNRTLNAELFYALSNLYEDLAEANLEAAIRWAYLFERAVAFKRLRPDLDFIQPDYRRRVAGFDTVLPAPDLIRGHLTDVDEILKQAPTGQVLRENPLSLRERYPIEFARFLQTRNLDFTISLYDLENPRTGRPGVSRRRLRRVEVTVDGLVPRTGFSGHITHHGFFTLRDRDTTLAAERFMPLPEAFDEAMNDLLDGKAQGDPIEGVIPFVLGKERLEISGQPQPDDDNPEATATALFDGYGETGHWTLELGGIDLRRVNDVLVTFVIEFPEADKELERHVEDLVRRYEAEAPDGLDKTAFFSLRQQFPDSFFELESGEARFELREDDFEPDITAMKVKTIVAQAVDAEGAGIEGLALELAQADGDYVVSRVTQQGGFTEAPDVEIPVTPRDERVPIVGRWVVRLADPSQFSRIDDLRLFFVYEFLSR